MSTEFLPFFTALKNVSLFFVFNNFQSADKVKCKQHSSFSIDIAKITVLYLCWFIQWYDIAFLTTSLCELMWNFLPVIISSPFQTCFYRWMSLILKVYPVFVLLIHNFFHPISLCTSVSSCCQYLLLQGKNFLNHVI